MFYTSVLFVEAEIMKKSKIITSAFSNLYTDQRIEKVCETLHKEGYTLEVIGNDWGGNEPLDRPYDVLRISLKSKTLKTGYLEFNWKLYHEIKKRITPETILHANDVDALWPNYLLAKKYKLPLVFDSHEIFSEMPAVQGRFSQKVWRYIERKVIPDLKFMMTASYSYAEWFKKQYGVEAVVVQNVPVKMEVTEPYENHQSKIILYQGAINPFRGIDKVIKAMQLINNTELHIAGDGPMKAEYEQLVIDLGLQSKVKFLGKLHPDDLKLVTRKADVGLSIEENGGPSYLFSFPNKVSDYIQARVPVVLVNFPEMMRILSKFEVGESIQDHHPETLAKAISVVLENGKLFYRDELNRAANELCWENESAKILNLFEKASRDVQF